MNANDMKKGLKVYDRWYEDWGIGIVTKVFKNIFYIKFNHKEMKYDKDHLQFLELAK